MGKKKDTENVFWENGDYYIGQFLGNNRTGKGKYFWPNGDCYEGDIVNNKKEGYGKYIWKDGNY